MEVIYNVINKYKGNEIKVKEEREKIINAKLFDLIIKLEKEKKVLNN